MAGLGTGYIMDEQTLRAQFDAARKAGFDVMVHYSENDIDLGSSLQFMMDCYADMDRTRAFVAAHRTGDQYDDFVGHLARNGTRRIKAVYDLSAPFEAAVHGAAIAQHPAVREAMPAAQKLAAEIERASRPWWRRIFG